MQRAQRASGGPASEGRAEQGRHDGRGDERRQQHVERRGGVAEAEHPEVVGAKRQGDPDGEMRRRHRKENVCSTALPLRVMVRSDAGRLFWENVTGDDATHVSMEFR